MNDGKLLLINAGRGQPSVRIEKFRRDYTARELHEMADRAAEGTPPPFSPARAWIADAQNGGDFERALALVGEVKQLASALRRMARAAEKAERRAAGRRGHIHLCRHFPHIGQCGGDGGGPCQCECGAIATWSTAAGRVVWQLGDVEDPFPAPREADHPKVRRYYGR